MSHNKTEKAAVAKPSWNPTRYQRSAPVPPRSHPHLRAGAAWRL